MAQNTNITTLERIIGYTFPREHINLVHMALQPTRANATLAMAGDSMLEFVVLDDMVTTGTYNKGEIQQMVSHIVSNANLFELGREIGLDKCVIVNPGQRGFPISEKPLTQAMEAVLWAVYVSSGRTTTAVKQVMERIGLYPYA